MESAAGIVVLILVLAFLAFFVFRGHKKGFLRVALTTFSFVIVIILANLLSQPVSNLLEDTAIGSGVENSVSDFIESEMDDFISGSEGELSGDEESSFLESLPLPSYIQNSLVNSNTLEEYASLQVETFEEYATAKVTKIILSVISYIIVMIIAMIVLRLILKLSKFVNKIPVIGGINKFLGALLGFLEGLLIIWAIGLFIIAFSSTGFGIKAVQIIQSNAVLDFIFENNLLVILFGLMV